MKKILLCAAALCLAFLAGGKGKAPRIDVQWETPADVAVGGYGRVHALNDGRYMLSYSRKGNIYVRFSEDGTRTWSDETLVMEGFVHTTEKGSAVLRCSNPEFAQISESNPHHPGRIIMASNLRPKDNKSTVHPFSIVCAVSDDGGRSWSARRPVYDSRTWEEDAPKGAWEPFVMELPDGTVQIYFTDNTPYFAQGDRRGNNISVVESRDGGDSWGGERIVCHSEGGWDGMPVVTLAGGRLYLAVEHKERRGGQVPMEMCIMTCPLEDNWSAEIPLGSPRRFAPYPPTGVYEGAPYLIHTENYFVLSFQSADGAEETLKDVHAVGEVRICPIADTAKDKLGRFYKMQGGFRPMDIDQSTGAALWNSLCALGGDRFCCVSQHKGHIWITEGSIVTK
ncbi:MAG: exo-alpha-sialidase [Bacteroidales bacterium]|nr:exo-alpha-sialidase [Bacteroidales bacterium]